MHDNPQRQVVFVTGGSSVEITAATGEVLTLTFEEA